MSRKVSVHLAGGVELEAEKRTLPTRGISATLATIIERYLTLCKASLPPLTPEDWDILGDVFTARKTILPEFLWAQVSKATSHGELAQRLLLMKPAEIIAIVDYLEITMGHRE